MRGANRLILAAVLAAAELHLQPHAAQAVARLETYGNFHAMGVIVSLDPTDDPNVNATAVVEYRESGNDAYRTAFPPSRVFDTRFATSLFWLSPGGSYDVRVTLRDPDGPPLDGQVLLATASTRPEVSVPPPSRSYHVSPGGSGMACDVASPCALGEGLAQAGPGEEVLLHGGVYYQGDLKLMRSGVPGAPIVLRGATGEAAILDGGDPAIFVWAAQGGGVYRTTLHAPDPNLVVSDGNRLYPYRSLADLQGLVWGLPGFYASGLDLYVRLAGGANPGGTSMVVSRHASAFEVDVDYIYFLDLSFRHYGLNPYPKAIYLNGASDTLIQGCTFAVNDLGIGIKRDAHRNLIQDNEFRDTTFPWPWDAVKAGSGLETGGVRFYGPTTGRGNVIRRNTFHDFFDGFGACPDDTGDVTNETDVYENLVHHTGDDGMETDGYCSNVRLWRNTFHDVLVGISLAPVYAGPLYAVRNLIYQTSAGNSPWAGNCFKLNSGYGQSGPTFLLHNTCDAVHAATSAQSFFTPGSATLVYARNNIWFGTLHALDNDNPDYVLDLDADDLYTPGTTLVSWIARAHTTLADFQAATGQEPQGLSADPLFTSPAVGEYTLEATSPAIDRGVYLSGINDDFQGAAPDIGAFEVTASGGCTLACSAVAPASAWVNQAVSFAASATPDSCTGSVRFAWDFGDGSSPGAGPDASHVYAATGSYPWRLTAAADTARCVRTGTIAIGIGDPVTPPRITAVEKLASPFRLRLRGSNFQPGILGYIAADTTPWPYLTRKSDNRILLTGGSALRARFPLGRPVAIKLVNRDGGTATTTYTRR